MHARLLDFADEADRAAWNALDAVSPLSTPFSSLGYLDACMAHTSGTRVGVVVEDRGQPVAATTLFVRRVGGLPVALLPPLTFYAPILLAALPNEATTHGRTTPLDALLEAVEARVRVALWPLPPALVDTRTLRWRGWSVSPLYTYRLALDEMPDDRRSWSAGARRLWTSSRDRFTVEQAPEAIPALATMLRARYAEQGKRLAPNDANLTAFVSRLANDGKAQVWVARNRAGAVEGGLVLLTHGTTAHYWLASSLPGPAMTVLVGEALARLRDEGFATFDFGGANTPSIAEFKRKFGSTLVPYARAVWTRPRALRLHPALRS